jgi:hypothetical protein
MVSAVIGIQLHRTQVDFYRLLEKMNSKFTFGITGHD